MDSRRAHHAHDKIRPAVVERLHGANGEELAVGMVSAALTPLLARALISLATMSAFVLLANVRVAVA